MQHGDSNLPDGFRPRVPVAGTLKIGSLETKGAKAIPRKLDHLRFCGPSPTDAGQYPDRADMADENKAHLKAFTIELVSDDPAVNLEVAYVMAGRGHVLCRGNGTTAERRVDTKGTLNPDQPFSPVAAGQCGGNCPFFRAQKCKLASTLRFRIPGKTDIGSIWQFRTSSWNTAQDLLGSMNTLKAMTGGVLARIPIQVFMTEQRRNPLTEAGGRTSSSFWTLGLSFEGTEDQLIEAVKRAREVQARMDALKIPTLEARLTAQGNDLLCADLSAADEFAVAAEFFPDKHTAVPAASTGRPAEDPLPASGETDAGAEAPGPSEPPAPPAALPAEALAEGEGKPASSRDPNRLTTPQESLIRRHAGRVRDLDPERLNARLETMTKAEATGFITKLLTNAEEAFKALGVVAA